MLNMKSEIGEKEDVEYVIGEIEGQLSQQPTLTGLLSFHFFHYIVHNLYFYFSDHILNNPLFHHIVNNLSFYFSDYILNNLLFLTLLRLHTQQRTCPPPSLITKSTTHASSYFSNSILNNLLVFLLPPVLLSFHFFALNHSWTSIQEAMPIPGCHISYWGI